VGAKGVIELQAIIVRSRGGLSAKIHTTVDVMVGNPTGFYFTSGQVYDFGNADVLLETTQAQKIVDRAYDAQALSKMFL